MRRRDFLTATGAVAGSATLARGIPSAWAETPKDTLLVLVENGPNSLDIHGVGTTFRSYVACWNLYDRLLTFAPKTLPGGGLSYDYTKIEPELAEDFNVSPEGMAVTLKLRRSATFHDGAPVTADDVKWSLDRAVTVGGFPTFQMAAGSLRKPEQFVVLDDHTIRIDFLRKDKLTLPDLAVVVPAVFNSKLAQSHASDKDPWAMEWMKTNDAGGGAFKLERWVPGQETSFIRFDEWKSGPLPKIRRVVLREVPTAGNRRALMERGDADLSVDLPFRDAAEIKKSGAYRWSHAGGKLAAICRARHQDEAVRRCAGAPGDRLGRALRGDLQERRLRHLHPDVGRSCRGADSSRLASALSLQARHGKGEGAAVRGRLRRQLRDDDLDRSRRCHPIGAPGGAAAELAHRARHQDADREDPRRQFPQCHVGEEPGDPHRQLWRMAELSRLFFLLGYHGQNALFNTMSYQNPALDKLVDAARFEEDREAYEDQVKQFVRIAMDDVPRIPLYQQILVVGMQKNIQGYTYWFHRQLDFRQLEKS